MGRGPDLTSVERAIIHAKILANWDSENNRIKHGVFLKYKSCAQRVGSEFRNHLLNEYNRGDESSGRADIYQQVV